MSGVVAEVNAGAAATSAVGIEAEVNAGAAATSATGIEAEVSDGGALPRRLFFRDDAGRWVTFEQLGPVTATSAFYYEAGESVVTSPLALTYNATTPGQAWWVVRDNQSAQTLWEQGVNDSADPVGAYTAVMAAGPGLLKLVAAPGGVVAEV